MAGKRTATEKFVFSSNLYQILSKQSGKVISVEDSGADSGTLLTMDTPDKSIPAQSWRLEAAGDGFCRIVNTTSGKSIDIIQGGTDNGAWLHLWETCDTDTQMWKLEPSSRGYYRLTSKASGKCIDIVDISNEPGAHLQIWDSVKGENQEWKLVQLSSDEESKKAPAPKRRRGYTRKAAKKAILTTASAAESNPSIQPSAESNRAAKAAPEKAVKADKPVNEKTKLTEAATE